MQSIFLESNSFGVKPLKSTFLESIFLDKLFWSQKTLALSSQLSKKKKTMHGNRQLLNEIKKKHLIFKEKLYKMNQSIFEIKTGLTF